MWWGEVARRLGKKDFGQRKSREEMEGAGQRKSREDMGEAEELTEEK